MYSIMYPPTIMICTTFPCGVLTLACSSICFWRVFLGNVTLMWPVRCKELIILHNADFVAPLPKSSPVSRSLLDGPGDDDAALIRFLGLMSRGYATDAIEQDTATEHDTAYRYALAENY